MTNEEIFRQSLIEALRRELVGPDLPPYGEKAIEGESYQEVLQESPTQRYSAGVLFPRRQQINENGEVDESEVDGSSQSEAAPVVPLEDKTEEIEGTGFGNDQVADAYDETVRLANEFFPSAIGLTFLSEYPKQGLVINAKAAIYKSQSSSEGNRKLRTWHRIELPITSVILKFPADKLRGMQQFNLADYLQLRTIYCRRDDGAFVITVSLLNTRENTSSKPPSGSECFFQVDLNVKDAENCFIFKEYHVAGKILGNDLNDRDRLEEGTLDLLYRNRKSYAVGHGCATDWGDEYEEHVNFVKIALVPEFKVPPIEPRSQGGDELSMFCLSGAEGAIPPVRIPVILENLVKDYEIWINKCRSEIQGLSGNIRRVADKNLELCNICLFRIQKGINLLKSNKIVLKAFMLANSAILMQQYHSHREKRLIEEPWEELPTTYKPKDTTTGRWRTFQIAFILMNLSSIIPKDDGADDQDREIVDLIWFPTGGGKTEAYLGLAAFDIFFRRLTNPKNAGCSVLMRYTLRLLTAQQFQRASSLICACEYIRRNNIEMLGVEPITIGLWVGESLTPTHRNDALIALNNLAGKDQAKNPFQLLKCPWCGTALDEQKHLGYVPYKFESSEKTVIFLCPEQRCQFSKRYKNRIQSYHLPILVIDDDIYEWLPTLIIGTVDKFAMLAWREQSGRIFGYDTDYDPPDLIIQDELHLISGPLGSVVGLYEAAIDLLCSRKGRSPKIVASTATIRRAWHQCKALYNRAVFQFPPQGLDISDSFFAQENKSAPGRIYVGVFGSAASSFVTATRNTLSALFQSCKSLPLPANADERTRDPYWTIIQYFNSLRELGHAATLVEADIPEYMWAIASRSHLPKELCRNLSSPLELTSRRTAEEIPEVMERLNIEYPRNPPDGPRPLDTLLATNMISVGVDIDRLGLMVIVGQPKTTSEYIQASSRVGRNSSCPGLVVVMLNPGKPRDRSHYEYFRTYHSAFYKYVEPTSVTPFSLSVMKRALHAVLIILVRHFTGLKSANLIQLNDKSIAKIIDCLNNRCQDVDKEHSVALYARLKNLLQEWGNVRPKEWGRFGKPPLERPLMHPAGSVPLNEWGGSSWSTPTSMRNVDVECDANVVAAYEIIEEESQG